MSCSIIINNVRQDKVSRIIIIIIITSRVCVLFVVRVSTVKNKIGTENRSINNYVIYCYRCNLWPAVVADVVETALTIILR